MAVGSMVAPLLDRPLAEEVQARMREETNLQKIAEAVEEPAPAQLEPGDAA